MSVLIVDDSRAMRTIVRRALRQSSYSSLPVEEAENGQQALDYLRQHRPTFVLCDWNMPELSGIELLQALKAEGINVKVGLVTSESTPEKQAEAIVNGARFLLVKPFDAMSLENAVDAMLSGGSAHCLHMELPKGKEVGGFFLPDPSDIQGVMSKLLGKQTAAIPWPRPLKPEPSFFIGDYHSHGRVVAQIWMDPACAVYSGAALTLLPARVAETAVKSGRVEDNLKDGVGEVFNVLARLFQRPGGEDLKFQSWSHKHTPLAGRPQREDLAMDVTGYGRGRMALMVMP